MKRDKKKRKKKGKKKKKKKKKKKRKREREKEKKRKREKEKKKKRKKRKKEKKRKREKEKKRKREKEKKRKREKLVKSLLQVRHRKSRNSNLIIFVLIKIIFFPWNFSSHQLLPHQHPLLKSSQKIFHFFCLFVCLFVCLSGKRRRESTQIKRKTKGRMSHPDVFGGQQKCCPIEPY